VFEYNPVNYYAYRDELEGVGENPAPNYFADFLDADTMRFSDGTASR